MARIKTEVVPIDSLELDPENLRKHEGESIPVLKSSLERFGQMKNIVVHHNVIIDGNGLAIAASELGWKEIEIKRAPDEWTSEEARAYAILVNRSAELSEWDFLNLPIALESLVETGFKLTALGWDTKALEKVNQQSLGIEESLGKESKPIECPNCGHLFKLEKK